MISAFVTTEVVYRLVFVRFIDKSLLSRAQRLTMAIEPCWQVNEGDKFSSCLDEKLRKLFPRSVPYAQIVAPPDIPGGELRIVARSYSVMGDSKRLSEIARQIVGQDHPRFDSLGGMDFDAHDRMVTLLVQRPPRPPHILQLGLMMSDDKSDLTPRERLLLRPHLFMFVFPLLLLGGCIWGYVFMRRVFAPIHRIVTLARRIGAEDLSHRIEGVESHDEIGELVDTLNEMISRLERSFRQLNQFSSDVAHELRTPLTIIKGELEVALKRERTAAEYRATLSSLQEEVEGLHVMIEDLLLLARMDWRQEPGRFVEVSLDEVVLDAYEEAMPLGDAKGVTLRVEPLEEARVVGDAGLLKRLIVNLLRNAINYTDESGTVVVALNATTDRVSVEISDTGCGIPEDAIPYIFDRFYRVDPSRTSMTGGAGLGLALVQKIAEVHNASVDVQSRIGKGTVFRVTMNHACSSRETPVASPYRGR